MNSIVSNQQPNTIPKFRGEILKQIYRIWLLRKLAPILVLEVVVITLFFYELGRVIFVQRIFENAVTVLFNDPPQIFKFFVSAFANAPILTKLLSLGIVVFIALVIRHLTQGLLRLILVKQNYFSKIK